jgi:hypothetical protein
MAVYKVPQDVEADDKLIGPFSFRQFIYLIVVAISMAGAWGLSQIFIPLAIIPLPIIVFFAALALPLRKDQPMEAYLSAVVSFYFLKSRKRFWIPDGIDSFVTIIPPKDADRILTKDLDEGEATRRLDFLAQVVDTHGWSIRGSSAVPDTSMNTDLYYEAQQTTDMMDATTDRAKALDRQLNAEADQKKKVAKDSMKTAPKAPPASATAPVPKSTLPPLPKKAHVADQVDEMARRDALTYAQMMAESISEEKGIPIATPTGVKPASTSVSTPGADTMELTREQADELLSQNNKVSVQTLGEQANRVAEKNKTLKNGDEVMISLR